MTDDFTVNTHPTPTGPVLEFAGELDAAAAPEALSAIQALTLHQGQQLVVDLTGLLFCDSSGISALIAARNLAVAAEAGIALTGVPSQVNRTLGLIGLGTFFAVYATAADARDAWASASER